MYLVSLYSDAGILYPDGSVCNRNRACEDQSAQGHCTDKIEQMNIESVKLRIPICIQNAYCVSLILRFFYNLQSITCGII